MSNAEATFATVLVVLLMVAFYFAGHADGSRKAAASTPEPITTHVEVWTHNGATCGYAVSSTGHVAGLGCLVPAPKVQP